MNIAVEDRMFWGMQGFDFAQIFLLYPNFALEKVASPAYTALSMTDNKRNKRYTQLHSCVKRALGLGLGLVEIRY